MSNIPSAKYPKGYADIRRKESVLLYPNYGTDEPASAKIGYAPEDPFSH